MPFLEKIRVISGLMGIEKKKPGSLNPALWFITNNMPKNKKPYPTLAAAYGVGVW